MASTQVAKKDGGALAISSKLAELFGALPMDDLSQGVSVGFPVLSIKGKAFHINQGGESVLITRPDDEDEPATSLNVILIKANPHISKVYYENGYEDGSTEAPTCYSNNGVVPEDDSEEKQSARCATCPKNAWGSRMTDSGKKGKACSDSRRVAVANPDTPDQPMLLRVPAASLKPLMQFGKALSQRKVPYQAIITKLSFDHTVAHPLLKFAPAAIVSDEQAEAIAEAMAGDVVAAILAGGNAEQVGQEVAAGEVEDEGEGAEDVLAAATAAAAAKAAAATTAAKNTKPKATAKPGAGITQEQVRDAVADVVEVIKPTKAATNAAAATAVAGAEIPADIDSMLGGLLAQFEGEQPE